MDMLMSVYTIFDEVAEEAGPLFTAKNDAVAVRSAKLALKDAQASDYTLYKLGQYDPVKCKIFAEEAKKIVFPVTEVK